MESEEETLLIINQLIVQMFNAHRNSFRFKI